MKKLARNLIDPPLVVCLGLLLALPALGEGLMEDCEADDGRKGMQCIHRNGVCVEVEIDGHRAQPIRRADRKRITELPDMDDVCWQIDEPVSAAFRVTGRGGGVYPDFIGELDSIGAIVVPIDDYDPEFDHVYIQPVRGFDVHADGYRDGSWQLRPRPHFRTPGSGILAAGEYVVIIRLHGKDNWDKQEILLRIDPDVEPSPADPGTPPKP